MSEGSSSQDAGLMFSRPSFYMIFLMNVFQVVTLLCLYIRGRLCSSCPENFFGFTEVLTCLHNITHGLNGFNVLAGTSTETIQKYCQNGTFNNTVTCLKGLYTECQNPKSKAWLDTIAKPHLWQHGINNICNNLQIHSKSSDCIVHQRPGIYDCLNYNDEMFVKQTREPSRTWTTITFNICRYYKGMRMCTGRQVKEVCDVSVGVMLEEYIQTITPLLCDADNPFINASEYVSSNYLNHLLTVIFASLVLFLNLYGIDIR